MKMLRRILSVFLLFFLTACSQYHDTKKRNANDDGGLFTGRTWEWIATETISGRLVSAVPERYTVRFDAVGGVQARLDCNRGGGSYTIEDDTLRLGRLFATKMACGPDSQDRRFVRDLMRVHSFRLEEGNLYLELSGEGGTMMFRAAP
ncbi:META domain-containing protein [Sulfurimonas sp. HSL1-2]|uniref:META domain-containing protein n=1 Tax=Thiomicrolovo zhangzhouensis TaxID=3131933 RepID=UPI0031FA185A